MSLNVKTMDKCRSDTCPKKSATWQPMMGATCQTESGRVEKRQILRNPKRRAGVLSCTGCALVSIKGSRKMARFAGHGGGQPLRQDRESRGRAERSKALEASTSRPIMNAQYEWAARGSGVRLPGDSRTTHHEHITALRPAVVDVTCKCCVADPLNLKRCLARVKQPNVSCLLQVPEDFACRLPMRAPGAVVELRQL